MAKKATATPFKIQTQKEEAAKLAASKALTPKHDVAPAATVPEEPSLGERLAAIDRRARERAEDEKRALAGQYLAEAIASLRSIILDSGNEKLITAFNLVNDLQKLTAGHGHIASHAPAAGAVAGTRSRMSQSQKEELAGRIKRFVNLSADGVSRSEVAAEMKIEPSQAGLVLKELHDGKKIGRVGEKASTRYLPL